MLNMNFCNIICNDIIEEIVTILIKEDNNNVFILRCVNKNYRTIAEKVYVLLQYDVEITCSELIKYIDDNKWNNVPFALFSSGFSSFHFQEEYDSFCGLFYPFELNAIIGDHLLHNYYRCYNSYYIRPLVEVAEEGENRVSIDIGDYEDDQEVNVIPNSYYISKRIQTDAPDISSYNSSMDFDMRLYNWRNDHEGYNTIPDIFTMYTIFQKRKCTKMDPTYPKKCIMKIINTLYQYTMDNIIYVYFYFYLSCRVMNIPCKNTTYMDFDNVLLVPTWTNTTFGTYLKDDQLASYHTMMDMMTEQTHILYGKIVAYVDKFL